MMSENKLAEKTRRVVHKQKELNELINVLESDVKEVFFKNKKLADENTLLREELAFFRKSKHKLEEKEKVMPRMVAVKKESSRKEDSKEEKISSSLSETDKVVRVKAESNAFIEFFLGKNIIAKIAAVLIFLGVVSFGQLAYVEWLNDIGRVLLIFFGGLVFGVIAYYSEKKEAIVFSNVFYGISVFIMFYSFNLARFGFDLINKSGLSYLSIVLMLSSLLYFWKRRYEFLDMLLFVFYLVVGMSILVYLSPDDNFSTYIELILFTSIIGYVVYLYFTKYFVKKDKLRLLLSSLFGIVVSVMLIELAFYVNNEEINGVYIFATCFYIALAIYFVYLTNFYNKIEYYSKIIFVLPIISIITLLVSSVAINSILNFTFSVDNPSFVIIIFLLLSIPLYIYHYRERESNFEEVPSFYIIVIALALFIYSFVAGNFTDANVFKFHILNIILGCEILAFFILAKFTYNVYHRGIAYFFILVFLYRNLLYYIEYNELLFTQSNVIFVSMGLGLILLGTNLVSRFKYNLENQIDNVVVQVVTFLVFVPFIVIFINDLLTTDIAYILAGVIVWVIGYRWLMELNIFKMLYKKDFILGMNILILILTLVINLFYFDHDFTQFSDVFKFTFMFIVNIYIVMSLREIFIGYCKNNSIESNFILLYLIGVTIHSLFLYNYINFEFDKVILSSYFLIASAVGVLAGFRANWSTTRKFGLAAIYFSLGKFFIYDFYTQDFNTLTRMVTYFILGFILLGISLLYAYLEKTYGTIKKEEEASS